MLSYYFVLPPYCSSIIPQSDRDLNPDLVEVKKFLRKKIL